MPKIQDITLQDSSATPVTLTFKPAGADNGGIFQWFNRTNQYGLQQWLGTKIASVVKGVFRRTDSVNIPIPDPVTGKATKDTVRIVIQYYVPATATDKHITDAVKLAGSRLLSVSSEVIGRESLYS